MASAEVDHAGLVKEIEDATAALGNARQATVRPVDSRAAREAKEDVDEATLRLARANAAYLCAVGRPYQQVPQLPTPGTGSDSPGKKKRGGSPGKRGNKRRRWPPKG